MTGPGLHLRPVFVCPFCGGPVGSLLAGCFKPACLTAELDDDARYDNS